MDYKVVELEEKRVAGLSLRTNNTSPDMGGKIGGLWKTFFEEGIFTQIPGKVNEKSIGLYTNYSGDETGDYDFYVCCEVDKDAKLDECLKTTLIQKGKYAKFVVKGHMQEAVLKFWQELWGMKFDRAFTCDFEEYQPGGSLEDSEIHIFIALN